MVSSAGPSKFEKSMKFRRVHSQYDRGEQRAYIEARAPDGGTGEIIVTAMFAYRTTAKLSDKQMEQEIKRKAHHALKAAAEAFNE
jgi:hypothetical protein